MGEQLAQPVIATVGEFDHATGSLAERVVFNHRPAILILCAILTLFLAGEAARIRVTANFLQMIPTHHPYIVNYLAHYDDLATQSDAVEIVVSANHGTILNAHYLDVLQHINDEVYLVPGVNRPFMLSLWSRQVQWGKVTADGYDFGPVIDDSYDGSPHALQVVADHLENPNQEGNLLGLDDKSSRIYVPLLLRYDGKPVDYGQFARALERIRAKYDSQGVTLRMSGPAMIAGGLIAGVGLMLRFFLVSIVISALILFWFTRCIRSTALVVTASLTAVLWQLGLLAALGLELTPYSVLVPFLVFAIGMSHGAQKMNGVMQDVGRGTHRQIAARYTFRRLFLAGFVALICDTASFAVLMIIRIAAVQQFAAAAAIGVALLVVTNLILIPVMLSYIGVSPKAASRSLRNGGDAGNLRCLWPLLNSFTQTGPATVALGVAALIAIAGYGVGRHVQIGDLQAGAPEFRQSAQYNQDNAYLLRHYDRASDTLVVMVDTPKGRCVAYRTLAIMDRLQWRLSQMPEVISAFSMATAESMAAIGLIEGSPKWFGLEPDAALLGDDELGMPRALVDFECSFDPIYIELVDHKAATLDAVLNAAREFIDEPVNKGPDFKMSLAAGNAGIAAATNQVVANANRIMPVLIYLVVIVFCFIAFRSWRAVLCAVIPLVLTSILAEALMVWLDIGVKVDTLPAQALGVGIGVDYAMYVLSVLLRFLRTGLEFPQAWHETMMSTGKVVLLTGFTLALGVSTWLFSPLKFQADMGLLLSFMFLWNMPGAMVLLPSLALFLLRTRPLQPTPQ